MVIINLNCADSVKKWWLWGYWTSPMMYAQNAIMVNEFLGNSWRHVCKAFLTRTCVQILIILIVTSFFSSNFLESWPASSSFQRIVGSCSAQVPWILPTCILVLVGSRSTIWIRIIIQLLVHFGSHFPKPYASYLQLLYILPFETMFSFETEVGVGLKLNISTLI